MDSEQFERREQGRLIQAPYRYTPAMLALLSQEYRDALTKLSQVVQELLIDASRDAS